jgi:hypothetical protein
MKTKSFKAKLIAHPASVALIVVAVICSNVLASVGSYTTDIVPPGDYDLLSWCFQAEDLNQIFNPADQTIQIQLYSNDTYYTSYSLGSGFNPDFVLQPGQAFFLLNWGSTNRAYTISGTNLSSSSYSLQLTNADWNAVAPAFLRTNDYLECVACLTNMNHNPVYTHASWNYHGNTNDLIYQWSIKNQTWVQNAISSDPHDVFTPYYTNSLYGTSPTVCMGKGFFIKPIVNKTWTQFSTPTCCDSSCTDTGPWVCPQ